MDYRRNHTPWYWIALFILYVGGIVTMLFAIGNPYLYSTKILKNVLSVAKDETPLPTPRPDSQTDIPSSLGSELGSLRMNTQRTGVDLSAETRDRKWSENWSKAILTDVAFDFEKDQIHVDNLGAFVARQNGEISYINLDGKLQWKFELTVAQDDFFLPPMSDDQLLYLATSSGRIIAIRKDTGALQWHNRIAREIISAPLLRGEDLLIAIEPTSGLRAKFITEEKAKSRQDTKRFSLARLKRKTGEFVTLSDPFEAKSQIWISFQPESDTLVLSAKDRLLRMDGMKLSIRWSQILPEEILPPAMLPPGNLAFVSTLSGKVAAINIEKGGLQSWELDLESPIVGALTYIPVQELAAVETKDGYLHMVDLKKGERKWKLNLQNESPYHQGWSTRLNGQAIEIAGLKWHHKGWTLWSPCGSQKICVYNPEKGELLERIFLSGGVLGLPFFANKGFHILLKNKEGLRFSHMMESDDLEKLKKAEKAEKAAQQVQGAPGA